METLDLTAISISELRAAPFQGLSGLKNLILSSSSIRQLADDAFGGLNSMSYLDLSSLGVLQEATKPFRNLKDLLSLEFSYSNFKHLTKIFQGLGSLEVLNLRFSNLKSRGLYYRKVSAFSHTPNLTFLSLKGNQLVDMYPETLSGLTRLITLDLSNCQMKNITPDIFRDLISLRYLYLDRNSIAVISTDHLKNLHSLNGLRLQSNKLDVLDKDLFINNKNLSFVSLSNNGLTGIAKNTLLPMKEMDLYGNPLACKCDLQWFRQYLDTHNLTVNNLDKTYCSSYSLSKYVGRPLLEFNPKEACSQNTSIYIVSSLLIVLFIIAIAIAYKYRWWLNYKIFLIKLLVVGYHELEDGREHLDYDYDVDVIFPDDDEPWVKDEFLVALVDRAHDFERNRIVCGEEDLPLGQRRIDAIEYVIENSFKIVVIVSNASVNDAHFLTQIQMAVEHMNEVQLEKVVMVFREDVPDNQLPYLVRLFLSKNKPYFEWTDDHYGQRLFWEKLMKTMTCNKKMNGLLPI